MASRYVYNYPKSGQKEKVTRPAGSLDRGIKSGDDVVI
jgi:hypothetical protein